MSSGRMEMVSARLYVDLASSGLQSLSERRSIFFKFLTIPAYHGLIQKLFEKYLRRWFCVQMCARGRHLGLSLQGAQQKLSSFFLERWSRRPMYEQRETQVGDAPYYVVLSICGFSNIPRRSALSHSPLLSWVIQRIGKQRRLNFSKSKAAFE